MLALAMQLAESVICQLWEFWQQGKWRSATKGLKSFEDITIPVIPPPITLAANIIGMMK